LITRLRNIKIFKNSHTHPTCLLLLFKHTAFQETPACSSSSQILQLLCLSLHTNKGFDVQRPETQPFYLICLSFNLPICMMKETILTLTVLTWLHPTTEDRVCSKRIQPLLQFSSFHTELTLQGTFQ
jgi:hypothetical protein